VSRRHYNITVRGNVQGVAFRFNAQMQAAKHDLCGFVRNLHNGDVYIEAEGEEENLNQFINWCHQGPRLAEVTEVVAEQDTLKDFKTFEVKR
jgi:acylphosphatase